MDEAQAKEILKDVIDETGELYNSEWYIAWYKKDKRVVLDGDFDADELEAIAFWIRKTRSDTAT